MTKFYSCLWLSNIPSSICIICNFKSIFSFICKSSNPNLTFLMPAFKVAFLYMIVYSLVHLFLSIYNPFVGNEKIAPWVCWVQLQNKIKVTCLPEGCFVLANFISCVVWPCEMTGLRYTLLLFIFPGVTTVIGELFYHLFKVVRSSLSNLISWAIMQLHSSRYTYKKCIVF